MKTTNLALPLVALLPLPAQTLLHSHVLPFVGPVQLVAPAGDTNGDGFADVVALAMNQTNPANWQPTLVVLSGRTGVPFYSVTDPNLVNVTDLFGAGDVNGDGRSDIVAVLADSLRTYSGSTGALLYAVASPSQFESFRGVCAIGDYDGNGRADLAAVTYDTNTSSCALRVRRGENGSVLTTVVTLGAEYNQVNLRGLGDLTGDGKQEIAIRLASTDVVVRNGATGAVLWWQPAPGNDGQRGIDAIDLDGDGKREIFYLRPQYQTSSVQGRLTVYAPTTGAPLLTLQGVPNEGIGGTVAAAGDLDQDGRIDFVTNAGALLRAHSGGDGHRLWSLGSWVPGQGLGQVVGVGDVDGDGFGEFVVTLANNWQPWSLHLMSARVLADARPVQPACGGGPFLPRLGSTRPVLGQAMTIAGQDDPPGAPGMLVLSFQPAASTWLGAGSCYAHFDLGSGLALAPLTQPQWSLQLPLPLVPQFAGYEFALQSWHTGTSGPLGYDLSNGVWLRLGYP